MENFMQIKPSIKYAFLLITLTSSEAKSEEDYYYQNNQQPTNQQEQYQQHQLDNQYRYPTEYNQKTYPDEQEGAIGYHGTKRSSDNSGSNPGHNGNYYYYYY